MESRDLPRSGNKPASPSADQMRHLAESLDILNAMLIPYRRRSAEINQLIQEITWLRANSTAPLMMPEGWEPWLFRALREGTLNGIPAAKEMARNVARLLSQTLRQQRNELRYDGRPDGRKDGRDDGVDDGRADARHDGRDTNGRNASAAGKSSTTPSNAEPDLYLIPSRTPTTYKLRLFIAGDTRPSRFAVDNLQRIKAALGGQCELEVIDILQQPERAEAERIIATPTLVRESPLPQRKIIGDLNDMKTVLLILGA